MSEAEAIPFTATAIRGERLLVLAPHPDDEVIGPGGVVAQHLRERRQVRVIVTTDGSEATPTADRAAYALQREEECRRGVALLGDAAVEFLRFPDRQLAANAEALRTRLRDELRAFRPDLLLVPSPIEIHPDHFALSAAFWNVIQSDETLFADIGTARVAFYEVSQPLRPNALVDISDVADAKWKAIEAHASQLEIRDYVAFARGLNAFRAMTLPPEVRFAEAYYTMMVAELRTLPFSSLQRAIGDARGSVIVEREPLPVSVIVRTKDRPALLAEAVASIRATGYPAEIVVVNDGGAPVDCGHDAKVVRHESSRGRSLAMNSGVEAAKNAFVAFLDDDDLYYPEHLDVLTRAAATPAAAWYSDAVSAFVRTGATGRPETTSRLRLFGSDFDRDLLLVDNYIPLPTLLVRREDFLSLGGFDPDLDLFEDWDFLIRLSERGRFVHVPEITCEVRHIEAGTSIVLATPEGSPEFRAAKVTVWKKHQSLLDPNVFANAFERQKRRLLALNSEAIEQRGRAHHLETDAVRLEREKNELLSRITALHEQTIEQFARIRQLEGIESAVERVARELGERTAEVARLREELESAHAGIRDMQTSIPPLYDEIRRLQALLDMIYGSRTWKIHTMIERVKGRS